VSFLNYDLLFVSVHKLKGVLQASPPAIPSTANCHSGSEPEEPKNAPTTGMSRVI